VSVHWYIYEDLRDTAAAACRKVLDLLNVTLTDRDRATLAVSGGSTPKLLLAEMANSGFDWSRTHLFWVDERGVPPTDAQTASLFPGEPLIDDSENLDAAVYVEKFRQWRITLLPGVLLAARNTIMLVSGEDKAEALRTISEEPFNPKKYAVQIVTQSQGNVMWFVDKAAARQIR